MTSENQQTDGYVSDGLPHHQALLGGTDWAELGTARGHGGFLPAVLTRLLDIDPAGQTSAIKELELVCHQNSFYEATLPVALYVAAILAHPATVTIEPNLRSNQERDYPVRAALLEWLGSLAYDADDECVAIGERVIEHPDLTWLRDELGYHARRLLATSTNRYNRSRSLDALRNWGYDTTSLETADDVALRNQHVRGGSWAGGCMDEPPF
ncbi:hypothetical protein ACFOZ0_16195 [Streptomyces yaanensis]|uniref:Uncharacterized protein n=1 Tax=Streptomyces yaanensis TaxID=1142239 RepID=A0ABV7SEV2_9ACTN|nr:hypothetical protein [Streptomyces sp. CGMCC 4.7035]WNB98398.1 hypothetical protein Q2K21_10105 [Streptomyces sp. CGMCC 4.7035]